ncbi:MAG: hypothetical protein IT173_17630 [Acidobacteria bacterium]|nr:hypothetical protein [Acidobacteriota bacterium]
MKNKLLLSLVTGLCLAALFGSQTNGQTKNLSGSSSYLFVWVGDADRKQTDFLAVVDVRPSSKHYGEIVKTVPVGVTGTVPHHTEHEMPKGEILFANGFGAGQTFRFDLSNPLSPRLLDSFGAAGEYMHPHSFVRWPNGNVLTTFQMRGHDNKAPGALAELDPKGRVLRISDAADPTVEKFIRPYSLAVVPALDRIVVTSADMDATEPSHVVQVWRYSDLKLIKSIYLKGEFGVDPAEPRVLADGKTVLASTFSCGLYKLSGLTTNDPTADFVYSFGGDNCALPVVAGNFWVATVPASNALISLDVSNPSKPKEVSRLTFEKTDKPHWIALEPSRKRIVMSGGGGTLESRLLLANIDPRTGKLSLDETFKEKGSTQPGINFDREIWPHGNDGRGIPHGAVFSRP